MEMRIRDIPDELHLKFKLICTAKRVSMNEYIIRLIEKEVEKREREKK